MRGYGRDYDDRDRYMGSGNRDFRDHMRHDPTWRGRDDRDRGYDFGGGYRGGRNQWGDAYEDRAHHAGPVRSRGYGHDFNDYGRGDYTYGDYSRQYPLRGRGGYDRDMQDRQDQGGHYGGASSEYGLGGGLGTYRRSGSFMNPTSRGDFFLGYGGSIRRGYTPYW